MMKKSLIFSCMFLVFLFLGAAEKDRLAVMDVADEDKLFDKRTVSNVTDYIFTKLQGTKIYFMVPKADRDTALDQAIEETVKGSRRECVDEKCQMSMVAQLQANFLINTKIRKLYQGTCNISISKFDVEKRAGVDSWEEKFNCTEKGLYETIDGFNFGGQKKTGSKFQEGRIGETVEDWDVGAGEETIVKFDSEPSEAIVLVDGRIVCQKTPCSKMVKMGKHSIVIQKENYLPKENVFEIKKGQSIRAALDPDFGWLTVNASVDVQLILDGQKAGMTPVSKMVINPGAHQVETDNDCFYKTGEKFQIKRGETKVISLDLKAKESAIKVTASDKDGNDLEADVLVDGKNVGTAPGTFKIPMCSREVAVKTKKGEFKQNLKLQEKKVSTIDAVLKPSGGNWSKISAKTMNWNDAKAYCANLNEDGYSDWRLPTISELRTLIENCPATETGGACKVDNNCLSSSCYSNACGGCDSASDGRYSKLGDTTEWLWSSSEQSEHSNNAWYVSFKRGDVRYYNKYNNTNGRCVR